MQLLVAHQVLIAAAIALSALFGVRGVVVFTRGGGAANLGMAAAALLLAALLSLYLRAVHAKWKATKRR